MITIETLRDQLNRHRDELSGRHAVDRLAVFGSVARGDANVESDVDLLVDFHRPVGLFHLIGTEQYLQQVLQVPKVDLVLRRSIIDELKPIILQEAVDVFHAAGMDVPSSAHAGGD
jgi:predicted nucleotidyltransferase